MWFVYIVECLDESLYTGITTDISARLKKHNSNKGAKYVKGKLPVRLVYSEQLHNKSEALKREVAIKKMSRSEKQKLIQGPIAQW